MEGRSVWEIGLRLLLVATMPAQLTVNGGPMVNGLHVPNPAEVVISLAQDQKQQRHLMEGKSAKGRIQKDLFVVKPTVQVALVSFCFFGHFNISYVIFYSETATENSFYI